MTTQSIIYGADRIHFQVCVLPELLKRKITIHVHPDGSVQVDAPEGVSDTEIREAVRQRARWIWKHVTKAQQQRKHVLIRHYVSGETYFYLGRRYVLKILMSPDKSSSVKLVHGRLEVVSPEVNLQTIKGLLGGWYQQRSYEYIQRRLAFHANRIAWVSTTPTWKITPMQKQWGSCSPKGVLSLNPHLIKAPKDGIDYVICHELCHLKEHNHSERYYRLLDRVMPEWRSVKSKLDGMAEILLNE